MRALDSGLVLGRDHNAAINSLFRGEASGPQQLWRRRSLCL